jgi:hypothetical protein
MMKRIAAPMTGGIFTLLVIMGVTMMVVVTVIMPPRVMAVTRIGIVSIGRPFTVGIVPITTGGIIMT